jgi:hypothetical protein
MGRIIIYFFEKARVSHVHEFKKILNKQLKNQRK